MSLAKFFVKIQGPTQQKNQEHLWDLPITKTAVLFNFELKLQKKVP